MQARLPPEALIAIANSIINMSGQVNASCIKAAAAICMQSRPQSSLHLLGDHCAYMFVSIQLFCTAVSEKTCADLWAALNAYACLKEPEPDLLRYSKRDWILDFIWWLGLY